MFKSAVWLAIISTIFIVQSSEAVGIRYISSHVHPDYPGKCFYNETQTPIEVGSIHRPTTECVEVKCGDDFVMGVSYCPRYNGGPHCQITIEKGVEFPGCCAKVKCEN